MPAGSGGSIGVELHMEGKILRPGGGTFGGKPTAHATLSLTGDVFEQCQQLKAGVGQIMRQAQGPGGATVDMFQLLAIVVTLMARLSEQVQLLGLPAEKEPPAGAGGNGAATVVKVGDGP